MRCSNCGWDNAASRVKCEKCNTMLSGSENSAPVPVKETEHLEKTVRGSQPSGSDYLDSAKESEEKGGRTCKQCGYPLITRDFRCPECGATFDKPPSSNEGPVPASQKARPKTIDPFRNHLQPKFSLLPQSREDEKDLPEIFHSGNEVILSRDNLEEGNLTITGGSQAVIKNDGGKWFIEDKSPRKTTFIQVNGTLELNAGDVILMGNRKYIFKPSE